MDVFAKIIFSTIEISKQDTNKMGAYLRGTILNRTYGKHEKLRIYLFLLAVFGPIYSGAP